MDVLKTEVIPALRTAVQMYTMDRDVIAQEAQAEKPSRAAWIIFGVSSVAMGLGAFGLVGIIMAPLSLYASVWVMDRVAQTQGGKPRLQTLLHCYALLSAAYAIGIIPRVGVFLALLVTLWGFVILATVVQEVYSLPADRAIKCVLGMIVAMVVTMGAVSMVVSTVQIRAQRDADVQRAKPVTDE
ncbi:MAG: YIP1 family protein [Myxococcota bacterium]